MSLESALKLLKEYSCTQVKVPESIAEKQELQAAVKLIVSKSEWENLGICAEDSEKGWEFLTSYLKALGYEIEKDRYVVVGNSKSPVYIKYNTQKQTCHLDSYNGEYRGVLISCQSEDEAIAGTYGYFPGELFLSK